MSEEYYRGVQAPAPVHQEEMTEQTISDDTKVQEKIHAVAGEILAGTKQGAEIAQREYASSSEGEITDIRFSQNGKTISLKDVLPGSYKIVITHLSEEELIEQERDPDYYECKVDTVFVDDAPKNGKSDEEFNLRLLHEAGHAVDVYQNKEAYQVEDRVITLATLQSLMAREKMRAVADNKLSDFDPTIFSELLDKEKNGFSAKNYAVLCQQFNEFPTN